MRAKIQKSLDYNKLLFAQAGGKLLKKVLIFPLEAEIKYDGNYTVVIITDDGPRFVTSGHHEYDNNKPTIFEDPALPKGAYLCERIATDGKLGDRSRCALRGPRDGQTAFNHKYMVHDYLTLEKYQAGKAVQPYRYRKAKIQQLFKSENIPTSYIINNQEELDELLVEVVADGYEGLMLKQFDWLWRDTKSRTIDCCKYKRRPTVDLLCIGIEEGEGKYEGMTGALILRDKSGRKVSVGSGMSDEDRSRPDSYFLGEVVEVFYEQIIDTYIQPTFGSEYAGVKIRYDKTAEDID